MKKIRITIALALIATICAVFLSACSEKISFITDIQRFSEMKRFADKIDVKFDNNSGAPLEFSIVDKNDLNEIMEIIFTESFDCLGNEPNDSNHTTLIIYQGEKSYSLSIHANIENKKYYAFSTSKLEDKINTLAKSFDANR